MENHSNPIIKGRLQFKWLYDNYYKCPICCGSFESECKPVKCPACNYEIKLNLTEQILFGRLKEK